ncbi:MAG: DUF2271 domain-containing protein [Verrucomicrobia bacterium]|nr:DUF2271 domain-containing protein [Verrucomicrobiota bacterium]
MNTKLVSMMAAFAGLLGFGFCAHSQTPGEARLEATLLDYNGSSTKHWTVVWVTTASDTFVKTLWKQGPNITSSHWNSHCRVWYTAKAGSTALDGYSSATAANYTGTNSPIILTWDGLDAANNLMPDGDYKFWVQYAEDSGQGPYTATGLLWRKTSSGATISYPDQNANFADMKVIWTPAADLVIASVQFDGGSLVIRGTGPANSSYSVLFTTDLNLPVADWTAVATHSMDGQGGFVFTHVIDPAVPRGHYLLRIP